MDPLSPQQSPAVQPAPEPSHDPARSRWATRFAVATLLFIALGIAAYAGRTWLVAAGIKARLTALGLSDVSLTVSEMNREGLIVDKLSAEHGAIQIARVKVTYTWPDLRARRVDSLTFSGLNLVIGVDGRGVNIGTKRVADLVGNFTRGGSPHLPYNELRVEGGAVTVSLPGGSTRGSLNLRVAEFNGAWQTTVGLSLRGRNVNLALHGGGHVNVSALERSTGDGAFEIDLDNAVFPAFAEDVSLHAKGTLSVKDGNFVVSTNGAADGAIIALAPGLMNQFPPALAALLMPGVIASAANAHWRQRLDNGRVSFSANGSDIRVGAYSATGIKTSLELTLKPLAITGAAEIAADEVSIGNFTFGNIAATITGAPGAWSVSRLGADFGGGRLSLGGLSLFGGGPIVLEVARLDLAQLAELAKVEGLSLSGSISGRVPFQIERGSFHIDDASLAADGKGIIRYRPSDPGALGTSGGAALALKALSNFKYDALTVALSGRATEEMTAVLAITGRNPDLYGGYPIALNFNVAGKLAEIAAQGLGAAQVPDAAVQRLGRGGRASPGAPAGTKKNAGPK